MLQHESSPKRAHITPVLKSLHWLPVSFRGDLKILFLVYKSLHRHAPEYITDMLSRYTPSRSLRSSGTELLTVPKARTNRLGKAAFSFYAPSLWNTLPEYLRMPETVDTFKHALKTYLFDLVYHSVSVYLKISVSFTSVCNPPSPLAV